MDADILTREEQKALALQGAKQAAKVAQERYGIDLAKVARDPQEALALVRAYAADAMLDPDANRIERGAAANLLLGSVSAKDREQKSARPIRSVGSTTALFGAPASEAM